MSITVEDGSANVASEAFCTVAFATTFLGGYPVAKPSFVAAANDTLREEYLRRGADFMVTITLDRISGDQATIGQRLPLPRDGMTSHGFTHDSNVVPLAWQETNALAAEKFAAGVDLLVDVTELDYAKSKTLDVLAIEFFRSPITKTLRGEMRREIFGKLKPFLLATSAGSAVLTQ